MFYSLFFVLSSCWWDGPHYIIAKIAETSLKSEQIQYINDILDTWISEPGTFSSLSAWQDTMNLKDIKLKVCSYWHYCDIPYFVGVEPKPLNYGYNVSGACEDAIKSILNETTTNLWSIGWALRNLAHFVADAHTPLHAIERFTTQKPDGDYGGNGFYISTSSYSIRNLHYLWDSGLFLYQNPPFTDDQVDEIRQLMGNLTDYIPLNILNSLNPEDWIRESFELAKQYAYDPLGTQQNQYIGDNSQYILTGQPIVKRRLATAAYRVSKVLQLFFERTNLPPIHQLITPTPTPHISNSTSGDLQSTFRAIGIIPWAINVLLIAISIYYISDILTDTSKATFTETKSEFLSSLLGPDQINAI